MAGISEYRNTEIPEGLLETIQRRVPLTPRPYEQLAAELNHRTDEIISAIKQLRKSGVIREISGIFDAAALGYSQTLAAFCVDEDRLRQAGETVAAHPGVSHCYGRGGDYNLWFTLTVSPRSRLGMAGTIAALAKKCRPEKSLNLPTMKRYKLHVQFGRATGAPAPPQAKPESTSPAAPTEQQIRAIRALQQDLPAREAPFDEIAGRFDLDTDTLLVHGADFLSAGWMRRYAAVLHHRAAGATDNVMVAWRVSDRLADAAGAACSRFENISHCYLRATDGDWRWNLFTMIHGTSGEECENTVARVVEATGLDDYVKLYTTREFKKRRVELFGDDERIWENENSPE